MTGHPLTDAETHAGGGRVAGVVTLSDPFAARHGGTLRTRGFIRAIEDCGFTVSTLLPTAPAGLAAQQSRRGGVAGAVAGRAKASFGTVKRHFMPMPTVWGGRDAQLATDVRNSRSSFLLVSVLSQAQYAAAGDAPYWLDFMDVWSDFAAREAAHRESLAALAALAALTARRSPGCCGSTRRASPPAPGS